jgi:putative addiction module killer protein
MDVFEIDLYQDSRQRAPFLIWLGSLKDQHNRARIKVRLNRIRLGNFGDCKYLGTGLYELRLDIGPGYRIYYAYHFDRILILLGGSKKNQSSDIKKAQEYLKRYKRQHNEKT